MSTFAKFYYSGGTEHANGVGFMVAKDFTKYVKTFLAVNDRLAVLELTGQVPTSIVVIYSPTEVDTDNAKDCFYTSLQAVIDDIAKSHMIIVAGDLNAQTGYIRDGWEDTMGPFGTGLLNDC